MISNNVVCATSKGWDQPAHTRSLIRAFASCLNILWNSRDSDRTSSGVYKLKRRLHRLVRVYTCQKPHCWKSRSGSIKNFSVIQDQTGVVLYWYYYNILTIAAKVAILGAKGFSTYHCISKQYIFFRCTAVIIHTLSEPCHEKFCFCCIGITKAQTSLHILKSVKAKLGPLKISRLLSKLWSSDSKNMSRDMGFPTIWYMRPAKAQTSLRICPVCSEPLLVA